jgi:hypothetical protein
MTMTNQISPKRRRYDRRKKFDLKSKRIEASDKSLCILSIRVKELVSIISKPKIIIQKTSYKDII